MEGERVGWHCKVLKCAFQRLASGATCRHVPWNVQVGYNARPSHVYLVFNLKGQDETAVASRPKTWDWRPPPHEDCSNVTRSTPLPSCLCCDASKFAGPLPWAPRAREVGRA